MKPVVHIRGMGLSCALGLNAGACQSALARGEINTVEAVLDGLSEPVRMPYYRIPDAAPLLDPSRFRTLIPAVVREALGQSGLGEAEITALPVFVGSSSFSISQSEALYEAELKDYGGAALPLVGFQHVADLVKTMLGCEGESFAFNTACTAAANALLSAMRMIELGRYKHALVLGVELANRTTLSGFSGLQLIAPQLKPFDLNRGGIVLGEGIGAVLLSSEGNGSGFVLRAGAGNCDTHSVTTANPDGGSIARLQAEALKSAGLDAAEIIAVKAHATASPMNDTAEAAGLHRVFNPLPPIVALKPYTGHTLGACGVNELILLAGSWKEGQLPPAPGFEAEDPLLKVSPLRARAEAGPGCMLLNYFGFGGSNCALVLERRP